jgi:diguanylate cyclase (GGDEF)-like protein/PAS domain S-box-containing protein
MDIDIRTLAIFMSLTNVLQVTALTIQYKLNKGQRGLGWWTLGTGLWAVAFVFNFLRDHTTFGNFAIIANNALFVSGLVVIYTGILRFFGRREARRSLILFCAVVTLIAVYFTSVDYNMAARRVNFSAAVAVISFMMFRALFVYRSRAVTASAHFLALTFLINGIFFTLRLVTPFLGGTVGDIFSSTLAQFASYLCALIVSMMWTFGFIILINQRLNADNLEVRENLEHIFNTSSNAVMITKLADGSFVNINDGFTEITGFTRADVTGKIPGEFKFWQVPSVLQEMVNEINLNGSCRNFETVLLRKDGAQWTGVVSAKLISLQGVPHLISEISDITGRIKMQEALKESEEKYHVLFRDSPDAFLLISEGLFVDCNLAAEAMLRGSRRQIIGRSPAELSPEFQPDGRRSLDASGEMIQNAIQSGKNAFEWVHRRFDESDFYVEVSTASIELDGRIFLFTDWRDISARKRAEELLLENEQRYRQLAEKNTDVVWQLSQEIADRERAQAALQESEHRYRLLAENTSDVIWVIDAARMDILYISPSVEMLLGYTTDEIMALSFTGSIAPESREPFLQSIREQVESYLSEPEIRGEYRNELVYTRKDGSLVYVEILTHCYRNTATGKIEIQGVSRDITERKRLEDELKHQATTDVLTGVFNRRHFLDVSRNEQKRAARFKQPISIALVDLDHFKQINDTYGHAAGDQALIDLTRICHQNIREIDLFARFGGDEFAVLLPGATGGQAMQVLERIHQAVSALPFELNGRQVPITITAGLACSKDGSESLDALLIRADQALYRAKETGRNRMILADDINL